MHQIDTIRLAELKSGKAIDDSGVLDEVSEDEFQIKAVDAMAVVLWAGKWAATASLVPI